MDKINEDKFTWKRGDTVDKTYPAPAVGKDIQRELVEQYQVAFKTAVHDLWVAINRTAGPGVVPYLKSREELEEEIMDRVTRIRRSHS